MRVFSAAFAGNVFVGQLQTRIGIARKEQEGPRQAALALLAAIETRRP